MPNYAAARQKRRLRGSALQNRCQPQHCYIKVVRRIRYGTASSSDHEREENARSQRHANAGTVKRGLLKQMIEDERIRDEYDRYVSYVVEETNGKDWKEQPGTAS